MSENEISFNIHVLKHLKKFRLKPGHLFLWSIMVLLSVLTIQCNRIEGLLQKKTPRQSYLEALESSPLANTDAWQEWLGAGETILELAVPVNIAIQQKLVYFSDEPDVWAWKLEVPAGRRLKITCIPADTSHRLFIDLFKVKEGNIELEESARDTLLEYESSRTQTLILRVQAELLIKGTALLTITDYPVLGFPVLGAKKSDIGSFWGDPRDGGARQHEGVDIFAPRNTPAIAVADGRIVRIGDGGIGGKTVWLRSGGRSMYYAHLDSINAHQGQQVTEGDTVGFVGNTGNARTTSTHLHFGIYTKGALDPLPFIDFPKIEVDPIQADISSGERWGRITGASANIRPQPSTRQIPVTTLIRDQLIRLRGVISDWYQIELPDGRNGYVHKSLVRPISKPLYTNTLEKEDTLFFEFNDQISFLQTDTIIPIDIYGYFGHKALVQWQGQWMWMNKQE